MKSKNIVHLFFTVSVLTLVFSNCAKDNGKPFESETLNLPTTPYDYTTALNGANVGVTNKSATLGRVLFYDKNLSINSTIACASCHKQAFAFADNVATSEGFKGERTSRNSPAAANLLNTSTLFWDARTSKLEDLVLQPIANHIEMGLDNTDNLIKKLSRTSYYPALFQDAFGAKDINQTTISKALSAFIRSMVSQNSRFDQLGAVGSSVFSASEARGHSLFFKQLHCTGCHRNGDLGGVGTTTFNIGLDKEYADNGVGTRSNLATDNGKFKVPSLRNVALTAPYMHDGRFNSLEEVVEHYNSNVKSHTNLSSIVAGFSWFGNNGGIVVPTGCWSCGVNGFGTTFKPLELNQEQKGDLVAFLKTLTDESFITDKKFSSPFLH